MYSGFREGDVHEAEVVDAIRELGVRITQATRQEGWFSEVIEGVTVRGQADGILPEMDLVLEIKTVGDPEDLDRLVKPKDQWLYQGEIYARIFGKKGVLFFVKERNKGTAKQFIIARSERRWNTIQKHLRTLWENRKTNPWELEVKRIRECGWCSWEEKCWPISVAELEFSVEDWP